MSRESLKFHIKSDDYFGTLATILDLLRQNLSPYTQKREKKTLEGIVGDLGHLQKKYKIAKKP
ncbi:MAG: hypothetical protein V1867_00905 [Candidatus Falkowbacteria bacterium]